MFARFYCLGLLVGGLHNSIAIGAEPGTGGSTVISLWNGQARVDSSAFEQAEVKLTMHLASPEKANGAALVICPGGGYGGLVTGPEGHGIADWLNKHGIAGFVLEYRLPKGRPSVPLYDAQRAIRTVRA